jgi:ABC-type branched-subunit amino acid transport system substrate-binding protein
VSGRSVLLSYRHNDLDRAWIERFSNALALLGQKVWTVDDKDRKPGESLFDSVLDGIRASDTLVLILGPHSTSGFALAELGAALDSRKPIIPIATEATDWEQVPGLLRKRQAIMMSTPEETARQVVAAQTVN